MFSSLDRRKLMLRGPKNYLPFLPFMTAIIQFALLAASYSVGALFNKSLDFLPYLHELAEKQPERGLLLMAFTFNGSLMFSIMLLRSIQINSLYFREKRKLNKISFLFGVFMILGQNLMVSFAKNEIDWLNLTAEGVYFISTSFYVITQTHISRTVSKEARSSRVIINLRMCCSVISFICPVAFTVSTFLDVDKQYKIPQASQWLSLLTIILFIGSFSWDFNRIKYRSYILDKAVSNTEGRGGTNYIDYLRNQSRSRKVSSGAITYQSNSRL